MSGGCLWRITNELNKLMSCKGFRFSGHLQNAWLMFFTVVYKTHFQDPSNPANSHWLKPSIVAWNCSWCCTGLCYKSIEISAPRSLLVFGCYGVYSDRHSMRWSHSAKNCFNKVISIKSQSFRKYCEKTNLKNANFENFIGQIKRCIRCGFVTATDA